MRLTELNEAQVERVINAPIFRYWGFRQNGLNSFEVSVLEVQELLETEKMLMTTSFINWSWSTWFEIFLHAGYLMVWVFLLNLLVATVLSPLPQTNGRQIENWQLFLLTFFMGHGALDFFAGGGVISYYLATHIFSSIHSYVEFARWFYNWFTFMGFFNLVH